MSAFSKFVTEEWYFAVPLFLMSLTAVTLVVWRLLLNSGAKTNMDRFWDDFQAEYKRGGERAALDLCESAGGLIPRYMLVAGLESRPQGVAAMRRSMANSIELDVLPRLKFLLPLILAIAKIATMVGLLLTVVSMINTFNAISSAADGSGGAKEQAGAIGLALFATALGLATAIPLVFSHVLFKAWIEKFELRMKEAGLNLIMMVQKVKPGGAGQPRPNPPAGNGNARREPSRETRDLR